MSDENGKVSIVATPPDTLVIHQLGYYLKKVPVTEIINNPNPVLLKAKNISLEEVTVSARSIDTLQNKNATVFLDFEFYDDHILTLVNKGRRYNNLLLLDHEGNKISELPLKITAETLYKDCFENIHLLSNDSVYQIYYDYQNLSLLSPYPITKYYDFIEPCECYHGSRYIFKVRHYQALKNTYFLYYGGQRQIIASVADSEAIRGFNMDHDIRYFLAKRRRGEGYATSVTEINNNIDKYREELVLSPQYKSLLRPEESEIKKIDSNFVLFDYTNKCKYTFSLNGRLRNKTPLHDFDKIVPKLYMDYDLRHSVFTSTNKDGVLKLMVYDKFLNGFTHQFELNEYHFIKDFLVKENFLYFINHDRESGKSKIVKVYLKWQKM